MCSFETKAAIDYLKFCSVAFIFFEVCRQFEVMFFVFIALDLWAMGISDILFKCLAASLCISHTTCASASLLFFVQNEVTSVYYILSGILLGTSLINGNVLFALPMLVAMILMAKTTWLINIPVSLRDTLLTATLGFECLFVCVMLTAIITKVNTAENQFTAMLHYNVYRYSKNMSDNPTCFGRILKDADYVERSKA